MRWWSRFPTQSSIGKEPVLGMSARWSLVEQKERVALDGAPYREGGPNHQPVTAPCFVPIVHSYFTLHFSSMFLPLIRRSCLSRDHQLVKSHRVSIFGCEWCAVSSLINGLNQPKDCSSSSGWFLLSHEPKIQSSWVFEIEELSRETIPVKTTTKISGIIGQGI